MKNNFKHTLVLLDVHAILHRAYHAIPDFVSATGEPTGGLYGLSSMLMRIINDLKPDYLIACYDRAEVTFRKEIYEHYKAGRPKTDEALVAQIISSRKIFEAFNIPIYDKAGFEADDIIGTIVENCSHPALGGASKDLRIIIASGDMDTMQLVDDDRVLVYTLKKGLNDTILYDEKAMVARFGFEPKLLPDYKGLAGDNSDNIIGIRGIGEKSATTLISNFGSLENIYKKLKKSDEEFLKAGVKARTLELLKTGEEEALFSKTLATIRRDAPIDFKLPEKVWRETFDVKVAEKVFTEYGFKSLFARLQILNRGNSDLPNEAHEAKAYSPELKIASWLLNSEETNPEPTKSLSELEAELKKIGRLFEVYEKIELPLIPILERLNQRGILIDQKHLEKLSKDSHEELTKLESEIYKLAGREFNINSPKQLGEILFDELKLTAKGLKKTAGGARSTRESELLKLKNAHAVIPVILKQRELQKLLSTYIDAIPKLVATDGRLHTTLNQMGTTTGRISSNDPNLQNIPQGAGLGQEFRRAFLATPGFQLLAFDYSQIEMRVLALFSGDEVLTEIFKTGADVHTSVAARVFRVAESEVTKEMRRKAKVINFGIIYGMGVNALRTNLGSTREEAALFYENYFATFPKIKNYFDQVIADATVKGYTETFFGRRRQFPGLKSKVPFIRASSERMAMNAPIQGTAADIVKLAMIKADKAISESPLKNSVFLLLQIHDELMYEVKTEDLKQATAIIKPAMESIITNPIPFIVTAKKGLNWAELR